LGILCFLQRIFPSTCGTDPFDSLKGINMDISGCHHKTYRKYEKPFETALLETNRVVNGNQLKHSKELTGM
jgi:hypothetical protein